MAPTHGGALMLVDTASLYYRAFYGVPDRRAPDQAPNNAIRGFLDMLATLVAAYRPQGLVACWDDDWRPAFRVAAIPTYKSHRLRSGSDAEEDVPPLLVPQVPVITEVLGAIGISRVGAAGYEADDVIGTLAERACSSGIPVDIVTGDRDLFQLVDDHRSVRVLYSARGGVRDADVVDQAWLQEHYGVATGAAYADLAVLRGDPSDGLPGVRGVGPKTAASLLATFGGLGKLIEAIDAVDVRLKGAQATRLLAARDYLDKAPQVVQVVRDCPLPDSIDGELPRGVVDVRLLSRLAHEYRLGSSIDRVLVALGIG